MRAGRNGGNGRIAPVSVSTVRYRMTLGNDQTMASTATTVPALRAEGISKSFGAVVALDGVSIAVARGECLALVGESGSG